MIGFEAQTDSTVAYGISLFAERHYREFDAFLAAIPEGQRAPFLQQAISYLCQNYDQAIVNLAGRRMGQHPCFQGYLKILPVHWSQGIPYINIPALRTRVHMSLFDDPGLLRNEIDYTCKIYGIDGQLLREQHGTIRARETHSFEMELLVGQTHESRWGMFVLETAETELHSLRIYASWYNDRCMATTHEKKALRNKGQLICIPTVICDGVNDTFLLIGNTEKEPLELQCLLFNSGMEQYPDHLCIDMHPLSTAFLPLSQYYLNIQSFLGNGEGSMMIQNNKPGGIYYYLIHNREQRTWQIQHL